MDNPWPARQAAYDRESYARDCQWRDDIDRVRGEIAPWMAVFDGACKAAAAQGLTARIDLLDLFEFVTESMWESGVQFGTDDDDAVCEALDEAFYDATGVLRSKLLRQRKEAADERRRQRERAAS